LVALDCGVGVLIICCLLVVVLGVGDVPFVGWGWTSAVGGVYDCVGLVVVFRFVGLCMIVYVLRVFGGVVLVFALGVIVGV